MSHTKQLRFMVVAESQQQRMAFSDTILSWGMDLLDCVSVNQLTQKHFVSLADVWLVDAQQDFEVIQRLEETLKDENLNKPKTVLVGFMKAPYINAGQPYEKWQRQLKRKLAHQLQRQDLLKQNYVKSENPLTWKYVIMLGASMGGPMAVKEFLDNLPNDLPVALILAQHFNSDTLSSLPRILTRQNNWRCDVIHHTQQLLAGRCLIVPVENAVVCDSKGRVIVQKESWQDVYQPSISQLLTTCSNVFGNHLLTIIFSGMGDDGARVAPLVKKNGSLIWVQDPVTSECPSQPQSMIKTGLVDYIASPKALAEAVISLCKKRCLPDGKPILLSPNLVSYPKVNEI